MSKKIRRHVSPADVEMMIWSAALIVALGVVIFMASQWTGSSNMELADYGGVAVAIILPLIVAHVVIDGLRERWRRKAIEELHKIIEEQRNYKG